MKATYVEIDGQGHSIFKDPVTDDGTKKSAKGLIKLIDHMGTITMKDECSILEEQSGLLKTVFKDGKLILDQSLKDIRKRLK